MNDYHFTGGHQHAKDIQPSPLAALAVILPITALVLYYIWKGIRSIVKR